MRERFGSKRRAKEEIFARYASFVYMGNGQYGFARAAEYYFGRTPRIVHDRRCGQSRDARQHRQVAPRLRADGARQRSRPPPQQSDARAHGRAAIHHPRSEAGSDAAAASRRDPRGVASRSSRQRSSTTCLRNSRTSTPTSASRTCCRAGFKSAPPWMRASSASSARRCSTASSDTNFGTLTRRALMQGSLVVLKNRDGRVLAEIGGREVYQGRPDVVQRLQPRRPSRCGSPGRR